MTVTPRKTSEKKDKRESLERSRDALLFLENLKYIGLHAMHRAIAVYLRPSTTAA